jgi:hypothetical protein
MRIQRASYWTGIARWIPTPWPGAEWKRNSLRAAGESHSINIRRASFIWEKNALIIIKLRLCSLAFFHQQLAPSKPFFCICSVQRALVSRFYCWRTGFSNFQRSKIEWPRARRQKTLHGVKTNHFHSSLEIPPAYLPCCSWAPSKGQRVAKLGERADEKAITARRMTERGYAATDIFLAGNLEQSVVAKNHLVLSTNWIFHRIQTKV